MQWPSVFNYILAGWAVGFFSSAAFHFATFKLSVFKRVQEWDGWGPK